MPSINSQKGLFSFIVFIKANKLIDQKRSSGVSVEIIKLPRLEAGKVIQIKAVKLPDFPPNNKLEQFHKVKAIIKWIIGENNLTPHSSLPMIVEDKEINQAINGGFEKYPKARLFDQSQYCASSTESSNGEIKRANILKQVRIINKSNIIIGLNRI